MPAAKRAKHQKSRRGCNSCKQRRTKCDEKHPICSTCSRLDVRCFYANDKLGRLSLSRASSLSVPASAIHDHTGFSLIDMELLHHWSTCTCVMVSPGTVRHDCWTKDIPRIALEHRYLLDQLLAVAALHMMSLDAKRHELVEYAIRHRTKALEGVKTSLVDSVEESAIPLFGFAGLTAIHAFAELALKDLTKPFDAIGQIMSCFKLLRGTKTIIDIHRTVLESTWAAHMIDLNVVEKLAQLHETGLGYKQAEIIESVIRSSNLCEQDASASVEALRILMDSIQLISCDNGATEDIHHLILTWPNTISDAFMDCLDRREPLALLIVGHYAVLMSMRGNYWWLAKWPKLLFEQIVQDLHPSLQQYLDWPRKRLADHLT